MKLSELLEKHGDLHLTATRNPFNGDILLVSLQSEDHQIEKVLFESGKANASDGKWELLCQLVSEISFGKIHEDKIFDVMEVYFPKGPSQATPKEVDNILSLTLLAVNSIERTNDESQPKDAQPSDLSRTEAAGE